MEAGVRCGRFSRCMSVRHRRGTQATWDSGKQARQESQGGRATQDTRAHTVCGQALCVCGVGGVGVGGGGAVNFGAVMDFHKVDYRVL